jgi:predicted Fe-Mo cluster-binding NifX family protein
MNICIPVLDNRGTDSVVCEHFGSAPMLMLVDSETRACKPISTNADCDGHHHGHGHVGGCAPVKLLAGEKVDAVVVGGIGRGALNQLQALGLAVYQARGGTVADALEALRENRLALVAPGGACGGHAHGHGHGHTHGHGAN